MDYQQYLNEVIQISKQAGAAILAVYNSDDFGARIKSDDSPLTEADLKSHHIIVAGLEKLTPEIPVLSEESKGITYDERKDWQTYWLVDPLDGTKEFIARNDEFTTNIALIHENRVILGVIYVPVLDTLYYASKGHGAFKQEQEQSPAAINVRSVPLRDGNKHYTVVASRRHGLDKVQALCKQMPDFDLASRGSSLKMCLVAEGKADLYPRLAPTSEWDTGAAQIIVEEAGGQLVKTDFSDFLYNTKEDLLNPHFYVLGDSAEDWRKLLLG
ncbi:MAG: 3'(2'),5'-bisphosphate nucleotidase CysQ [Gammaproteobacteria bacterium]|nr:3'(2'),5'-bisphosphate nucleotidase CysQ [Gammaproteobacteria bacterium]NVK86803.1 3'(2'),5'-bisphosphate nucleotidase CysQ [Gammaproteobacteria bacterium]